MGERATFDMVLGRLYWRHIRDFISRAKFEGRDVSLWEGSGFFDRPFTISGKATDVAWARECLKRWFKAMDDERDAPESERP